MITKITSLSRNVSYDSSPDTHQKYTRITMSIGVQQRTGHACASLKCIAYSFFDVHCMGRLNSTRLVLLHFPDPVIVLTVC